MRIVKNIVVLIRMRCEYDFYWLSDYRCDATELFICNDAGLSRRPNLLEEIPRHLNCLSMVVLQLVLKRIYLGD